MIEKLKKQNTWGECLEKLNEVIDAVNELQMQESDTDDIAEVKNENIYTKSMRMEKEFAETECEHLQKNLECTQAQLEIAMATLWTLQAQNGFCGFVAKKALERIKKVGNK